MTAGASDLAPEWLAQLGPGGRIALPLGLRGIQLCIALERSGGLAGAAAPPAGAASSGWRAATPLSTEQYVPLGPQPGLHLQADGRADRCGCAVGRADRAGHRRADRRAGVRPRRAGRGGPVGHDHGTRPGPPDDHRRGSLRGSVLPLLPFGALAATARAAEGLGVAGLVPAAPFASSAEGGEHRAGDFEVTVRGFGPWGALLAERLAGRVAAWRTSGRPRAADLVVTAYPWLAGGQPPGSPRAPARSSSTAPTPAWSWPGQQSLAPAARPGHPCPHPAFLAATLLDHRHLFTSDSA